MPSANNINSGQTVPRTLFVPFRIFTAKRANGTVVQLTTAINTSQPLNAQWWIPTPELGDNYTLRFVLAAGTYTFQVLGLSRTGGGTLEWRLDDQVIVAAEDWYSAANQSNVVKSYTVNIAASGEHTLKATLIGRNAANTSGYEIRLTDICFF